MKKKPVLLSLPLILFAIIFSGLHADAQQALYNLSVIEWVKPHGDNYKIYINGHKKIVIKDEISLETKEAINGHKTGQWALIVDPKNVTWIPCKISAVFANGQMATYCHLITDYESNTDLSDKYVGTIKPVVSAAESMPELKTEEAESLIDQEVRLTKATGTLSMDEKVIVRAIFKNEKVLVRKKGFTVHTPIEDAHSVLVDLKDLQK